MPGRSLPCQPTRQRAAGSRRQQHVCVRVDSREPAAWSALEPVESSSEIESVIDTEQGVDPVEAVLARIPGRSSPLSRVDLGANPCTATPSAWVKSPPMYTLPSAATNALTSGAPLSDSTFDSPGFQSLSFPEFESNAASRLRGSPFAERNSPATKTVSSSPVRAATRKNGSNGASVGARSYNRRVRARTPQGHFAADR